MATPNYGFEKRQKELAKKKKKEEKLKMKSELKLGLKAVDPIEDEVVHTEAPRHEPENSSGIASV